jgi:3-isopropylmalate/(R)-2-methylmalate dehydratase small subunit
MKLPPEELAQHCLEAVDPGFAASVRPGDFVVGGRNFGLGSSREQAAISLKLLGVSAVIAQSFARIFYRNAMNIGLIAIALPEAAEIGNGDRLTVDAEKGRIENLTQACVYNCPAVPAHLLEMIRDGGLMSHLKKRRAQGQAARSVA